MLFTLLENLFSISSYIKKKVFIFASSDFTDSDASDRLICALSIYLNANFTTSLFFSEQRLHIFSTKATVSLSMEMVVNIVFRLQLGMIITFL